MNNQNKDSPDKQVKIAYLILVHRLPKQFIRLFKAIYDPKNHYLIHLDKGADRELHEEVEEFINDFPNTYLLESESVVWGGYSMVHVELSWIKYLINKALDWDFFINLSGQDYPLKSQEDINEFLAKNRNNSFLKVDNQLEERPDTMNRIENFFTDDGNTVSEKPNSKRVYLKDVIPYIGGQWMILTRKCCDFICNSGESQKFEDFYLNTLIADEAFFQTLLMNSSFDGKIINNDKRAIIWVPDWTIKLRPKTFIKDDIVFLQSAGNLFARKFDDNIDPDIINNLNLKMNGKKFLTRMKKEKLL